MPRYTIEELLSKDKTELDKIKTVLDIYQSEDKYAFEKKKFKTENLRFFAIAIMTAVISLGSSYFIEMFKQKNNSQGDVKKEFTELKKNYLTEKDKNKQNELACALAGFDNFYKDRTIETAQKNFNIICSSVSAIQQQSQVISNTDTSSANVKEALTKIDQYDKQIQDLKQKQKTATTTEKATISQQIAAVNKDLNTVVNSVPEIKSAVNSTEKIEQNVTQIELVNKNIVQRQTASDDVVTKSRVTWFKEGYFLQFGEYRVLLQYLDKKLGIQVQVCKTASSGACPNPLLTKAWVKFGAPIEFSDNGHSYRINLETIDHAGKNPFTMAAYITFETLK
jgi:methyl-accepting chemotaxis protein